MLAEPSSAFFATRFNGFFVTAHFAEKLRLFMCVGAEAVLLRDDMEEMLYADFAALGQSQDHHGKAFDTP